MLQVAIGRRIFDTDQNLSDLSWLAFQQDVEESLQARWGKLADTKALGVSSFDGVAEDTCIFVWFDVNTIDYIVESTLSMIATRYSQYSIAVTVGETTFIEGV